MKAILFDRYLARLIFTLWLRGEYRLSKEVARLKAAEQRKGYP